MSLHKLTHVMLPELENTLKLTVYKNIPETYPGVREMMAYHLGWSNGDAVQTNQGKKIRPLLVLLSTELFQGNWKNALPAAASVELLHNFSLIHDDIEDNSDLRRGRKTMWKIWGVPQAINTGDAMFSLAQLSIANLADHLPAPISLEAVKLFSQTCLKLTGGQYLDMDFENRTSVTTDIYFDMIKGKTAALLSASTEFGAIISQTSARNRKLISAFGLNLGLAFQVWDDWLGIWGNETEIGKSISTDLMSGKKTMPILYALEKNNVFASIVQKPGFVISEEILPELITSLEADGAKDYTKDLALNLTNDAINSLNSLENVDKDIQKIFFELTDSLLNRNY